MATEEINVRKATSKDIDGIISVLESTCLNEERWTRNGKRTKRMLHESLKDQCWTILIAEAESAIVGFIDCAFFPSLWEVEKQGLIVDLFVRDDYQGKGIGSRLLRALIEHADATNVCEVHVSTEQENERARKLYSKNGFKEEHILLERPKEST